MGFWASRAYRESSSHRRKFDMIESEPSPARKCRNHRLAILVTAVIPGPRTCWYRRRAEPGRARNETDPKTPGRKANRRQSGSFYAVSMRIFDCDFLVKGKEEEEEEKGGGDERTRCGSVWLVTRLAAAIGKDTYTHERIIARSRGQYGMEVAKRGYRWPGNGKSKEAAQRFGN